MTTDYYARVIAAHKNKPLQVADRGQEGRVLWGFDRSSWPHLPGACFDRNQVDLWIQCWRGW